VDSTFQIKNISELHQMLGYEKPKHPLVTVIDLSKTHISKEIVGVKLSNPFYSISLKTKTTQSFKYGRKYFDFQEGVLLAMAPEQISQVEHVIDEGDLKGWSLIFHPDLIRRFPLNDKISEYGFFSYAVNEALHISEKEKQTITSIIDKIREEYDANIDEYSQDVLVANIELLLSYIQRYYKRQFITRQNENKDVISKFEKELKDYISSEEIQLNGLPTVRFFADRVSLSASYLSDLLKKETGKSAQEHIHYQLIEKAKTLLLNSESTISEIAYQLGFEYPQYFSRVFKAKTGITAVEFRTLN
jgi:AraC-like DNA-binding protein